LSYLFLVLILQHFSDVNFVEPVIFVLFLDVLELLLDHPNNLLFFFVVEVFRLLPLDYRTLLVKFEDIIEDVLTNQLKFAVVVLC
jgi:hypothetical protein